MRYRGDQKDRERFLVSTAMLCESLSQEKGDALLIALKGKHGLFCAALVWNEDDTGHCFEVSKRENSFGSFRRGQNAPFSSHQLSSELAFTLQQKTNKRHANARVPGWVQKRFWYKQCVCTTGEDCHPEITMLPTDCPQTAEENGKIVVLQLENWFAGTLCSTTNKQVNVAFLWW